MSTTTKAGHAVCTACGKEARFHKLATVRVRCPDGWGTYDTTPRGEADARASTEGGADA